MFTGLIAELAQVVRFEHGVLELRARHTPQIGDSIAINGACLSVISLSDGGFCVELSQQTARTIAVENLRGSVHLEPALLLGARVEGHLVQGHIDGVGEVVSARHDGRSLDLVIEAKEALMDLMIPKGSVAIDGVSLTINTVTSNTFALTLIPLTQRETLLGNYTPGRRVNIETDLLVRALLHWRGRKKSWGWHEVDLQMALY